MAKSRAVTRSARGERLAQFQAQAAKDWKQS